MTAIDSSVLGPARPSHTARVRQLGAVAAVAAAAAASAIAIATMDSQPSPASSATPPAPLTERVLARDTFSGFTQAARPVVIHSAARWAATAEQSLDTVGETARLQRLGFVGGINEQQYARAPLNAVAMSTVEQFKSPAGARSELATEHAQAVSAARANGSAVTAFRVSGIPGAVAWSTRDAQTTATNVAFSYGNYEYAVGVGHPSNQAGGPARGNVVTAAQMLYLQATGCVAGHAA
jgi:hypothetical protein